MTLFNEISVSTLADLIGTPDCPVLLDVRIGEDFDEEPVLIPSAFRQSFTNVSDLAEGLKGQSVVVYCQKGLKISQGAAALLRNEGVHSVVLEGGQFAWRDAGEPMVLAENLPALDTSGRTVWVTQQRPNVSAMACSWLLRRFIDPKAQILFVAPSQVRNVAEKFNATPFEVEGVFWSGKGTTCTFDTMIEAFGIKNEALAKLAMVVRGSDNKIFDLAPEAAGLLATSRGLLQMHRDDLKLLETSMMIYDVLYRWARDETE